MLRLDANEDEARDRARQSAAKKKPRTDQFTVCELVCRVRDGQNPMIGIRELIVMQTISSSSPPIPTLG